MTVYIHIGGEYSIFYREILGVFDIDVCTISHRTRKFLRTSQEREDIVTVSDDIPKSFIVSENEKKNKIYITPISPSTLKKRSKISRYV